MPSVTPNELRHTAASNLSAAGVPIEQIADVLGHNDTAMLMEVYRHAPLWPPRNTSNLRHQPGLARLRTDTRPRSCRPTVGFSGIWRALSDTGSGAVLPSCLMGDLSQTRGANHVAQLIFRSPPSTDPFVDESKFGSERLLQNLVRIPASDVQVIKRRRKCALTGATGKTLLSLVREYEVSSFVKIVDPYPQLLERLHNQLPNLERIAAVKSREVSQGSGVQAVNEPVGCPHGNLRRINEYVEHHPGGDEFRWRRITPLLLLDLGSADQINNG